MPIYDPFEPQQTTIVDPFEQEAEEQPIAQTAPATKKESSWGYIFNPARIVNEAGAALGKAAGGAMRAIEEFTPNTPVVASNRLFQILTSPLKYVGLEEVPEFFAKNAEAYKQGIGKGLENVSIARGEKALGMDETTGAKVGRYYKGIEESLTPATNRGSMKAHVAGAIKNLAANAPNIAIGAATGGTTLPLMMMGAQSGATDYGEKREAGIDPETSLAAGAINMATEVGTEKLPLEAALKIGTPYLVRLGKTLLTDPPGEIIATLIENGVIDPATVNPNKTLTDLGRDLIDTVIQTGLSDIVFAGMGHAGAKYAERQLAQNKANTPRYEPNILPQDFFDEAKSNLESGGATIDQIKEFRTAYASRPDAHVDSLTHLDNFISAWETKVNSSPEEIINDVQTKGLDPDAANEEIINRMADLPLTWGNAVEDMRAQDIELMNPADRHAIGGFARGTSGNILRTPRADIDAVIASWQSKFSQPQRMTAEQKGPEQTIRRDRTDDILSGWQQPERQIIDPFEGGQHETTETEGLLTTTILGKAVKPPVPGVPQRPTPSTMPQETSLEGKVASAIQGEGKEAQAAKEPWEMARDDFYSSEYKKDPVAANKKIEPDWDTVEKATGIKFKVLGNNTVRPVLRGGKDTRNSFTEEEERKLRAAFESEGYTTVKRRIAMKGRYQETEDISEGQGFSVNVGSKPTNPKHYKAVRQALAEGKPVPPEVLKDYPGLAQKFSGTKPAETGQSKPTAPEKIETPPASAFQKGDKVTFANSKGEAISGVVTKTYKTGKVDIKGERRTYQIEQGRLTKVEGEKPYEERSGRKLLLDVARTPDTGLSVPFPTAGVENRADDSRRWDRSSFESSIAAPEESVKEPETSADLTAKPLNELVTDIFAIINDHIGERGSVSGKKITVNDSLYEKLKPYLAEIARRAKEKALDVKAYLFGAVNAQAEGQAKDIYRLAATRYVEELSAPPKPKEEVKPETQKVIHEETIGRVRYELVREDNKYNPSLKWRLKHYTTEGVNVTNDYFKTERAARDYIDGVRERYERDVDNSQQQGTIEEGGNEDADTGDRTEEAGTVENDRNSTEGSSAANVSATQEGGETEPVSRRPRERHDAELRGGINRPVKKSKEELAVANKKLGAPFEFSQELAEKTAEMARLEADLAAEDTNPQQDTTGTAQYSTGPHTPGDLNTLAELKKIFKGQKISVIGGVVKITTKSGHILKVETVDFISPDEIAFKIGYGRASTAGVNIVGQYKHGTISLTRGSAGKFTVVHESIHFLEDAGLLTSTDVATLRGEIKRLVKEGKWTPTNPKDIGGAEDRANYIAQQLTNPTAKSFAGRVIERIREWIDRLMEAFGHERTARGVVRSVETGEVFERRGDRTYPFREDGKGSENVRQYDEKEGLYHADGFHLGERGPVYSGRQASKIREYAEDIETFTQGQVKAADISPVQKLTRDQQRLKEDTRKNLGSDVIFFDGKGTAAVLGGQVSPDSPHEIFVNVNAPDIDAIVHHESFHSFAITEPNLLQKLFEAVAGNLTGLEQFHDKANHARGMVGLAPYSLRVSAEELLADIVAGEKEAYRYVDDPNVVLAEIEKVLYRKALDRFAGPFYSADTNLPPELAKWLNPQSEENKQFKSLTTDNPLTEEVLTKDARGMFDSLKARFGNQYVDDDMKTWKRAFSLPYWLGKKYAAVKHAVDIEIHGVEQYSKDLFNDYEGGLQDSLDTVQKDKKLSKQFIDLVWKWEGKPFPESSVPSSWMKVDSETKEISINEGHYDEIRDYLEEQKVHSNVIDSFVKTRRILDEKLLDMWQRVQETEDKDLIQQFRSDMGKIHNYFPHRRTGDSHVTITNRKTGEVAYREHYYKITDRFAKGTNEKARARADMWLKDALIKGDLKGTTDDYRVEEGPVKNLPDEVFFQIPVEAMQQIVTAAAWNLAHAQGATAKDKSASFDSMDKALSKAVSDVLKSRGFGGHMIQRKGIPGFETEPVYEILFDYLSGYAGFKAKMERARLHHENLVKIDAKRHPTEYSYTSAYTKDMLENSNKVDRAVNTLRGVFFIKYLGGVVKSGLVNLSQNIVVAAPVLSMYTKGADRKIAMAMYDTKRALTSKAAWTGKTMAYPGLKANEQKALHDLIEEGATTDSFVRELKGNIAATGWFKRTAKAIEKAGVFMSVAEKFNRTSTGLAAYRVAYNEGVDFEGKKTKGNHDLSVKFAEEIILDSHFLYGKRNYPELMRGGDVQKSLSSMYTFRQFSHNYISLMAHLIAGQGKEGKIALARSMRNLFFVGGLGAIPFFKALAEALMWAIGDDDEDAITKIRAMMPSSWLKDMVVYGLPGVAGVDLTGSLSIEMPTSWMDIIGVPGAAFEDTINTAKSIKAGNTWRAAAETPFTPIAIRNAMKGIELYTEGQRSRGGKNINYQTEKGSRHITAGEAIAKGALGLQPVSSSNMTASRNATERMKNALKGHKQDWADRYVNARRRGDTAEMREVRAEIKEWNTTARKEGKTWRFVDIQNMIASRLSEKSTMPKTMRRETKQIESQWK